MIKLIEICESLRAAKASKKSYTLREIYVNPKHVISLREEIAYESNFRQGPFRPRCCSGWFSWNN